MAALKRTVDLSSEEIQQAWQDVRNDAAETNWVLLTYGDNGEIILCGKGSGGLNEMRKKLKDNQIYVGVIRVRAVDDYGSQRAKFVYINYVGVAVPTLRAARASMHKHDFERLFNGYHIQIYANAQEELSEDNIIATLQACAGAHKPQAYEFA
ncbi:unnamed protein product [Rotaria socialis]|uniref:Coactosin-like protein n=1 Tax=Rotaria socialis TaxID=392032 RepID=A0A817UZC7_9BILA|nr:unnamed protein product [Rotaria socialis]CAF3402547.1 unnamed protein product [Rotaria socialis]CAF3450224.1 unnamed protein product [Rotaria socialis]CAF3560688.1 unnamed protein product [Rotaria socialis]CAF3643248.1 unnamed protein product [Rotaria socialis]